jgi:hypothetical protein
VLVIKGVELSIDELKNNPLFDEIEQVETDEFCYNKTASHNIDNRYLIEMTRLTSEKLK